MQGGSTMKITTLRGHHLLCVHGFQGMGYSPSFVANMEAIVGDIRDPACDVWLEVRMEFDDICSACPHKGRTVCEAGEGSDPHVKAMDGRVIRHLGIERGGTYRKEWLMKRIARLVEPDDLDELCAGCSWLGRGVCKDGIRKLKERYAAIECV